MPSHGLGSFCTQYWHYPGSLARSPQNKMWGFFSMSLHCVKLVTAVEEREVNTQLLPLNLCLLRRVQGCAILGLPLSLLLIGLSHIRTFNSQVKAALDHM